VGGGGGQGSRGKDAYGRVKGRDSAADGGGGGGGDGGRWPSRGGGGGFRKGAAAKAREQGPALRSLRPTKSPTPILRRPPCIEARMFYAGIVLGVMSLFARFL